MSTINREDFSVMPVRFLVKEDINDDYGLGLSFKQLQIIDLPAFQYDFIEKHYPDKMQKISMSKHEWACLLHSSINTFLDKAKNIEKVFGKKFNSKYLDEIKDLNYQELMNLDDINLYKVYSKVKSVEMEIKLFSYSTIIPFLEVKIDKGEYDGKNDSYYAVFTYTGQKSIDKANEFLNDFISSYNKNNESGEEMKPYYLDRFNNYTKNNTGIIGKVNVPVNLLIPYVQKLVEENNAVVRLGNDHIEKTFDLDKFLNLLVVLDNKKEEVVEKQINFYDVAERLEEYEKLKMERDILDKELEEFEKEIEIKQKKLDFMNYVGKTKHNK